MSNIKIRSASVDDDAVKILNLIYDTDPYIYPELMRGQIDIYKYLLTDGGMYSLDNILLALIDDEIVGLMIHFDNTACIPSFIGDVLIDYYNDLKKSICNDAEYINNLSVLPEYRGRGVASSLINHISNTKSKNKLQLHCLLNNQNAFCLYLKLGFCVVGIEAAFCPNESSDIKSANMIKELICMDDLRDEYVE